MILYSVTDLKILTLPHPTSSLTCNPSVSNPPSLGKLPSTSKKRVSFFPALPLFPINISNLVVLSVNLNDSSKLPHTLSLPGRLKGHDSNLTSTELSGDSPGWRGSEDGHEGDFYILAVSGKGLIFLFFPNSGWEAGNIHPHAFMFADALSKVPED